jgi:hypothetical protein
MSYDCYCDYDQPSVFSSKIVVARKEHRCGECRRLISIGERYKYIFGVWDGDASSHYICEHCSDIQKFVTNNIPCFCWYYGSMLEDAKEAIQEAYFRAGEEVRGVAFGLGRLLVKARRARASLPRIHHSREHSRSLDLVTGEGA